MRGLFLAIWVELIKLLDMLGHHVTQKDWT